MIGILLTLMMRFENLHYVNHVSKVILIDDGDDM